MKNQPFILPQIAVITMAQIKDTSEATNIHNSIVDFRLNNLKLFGIPYMYVISSCYLLTDKKHIQYHQYYCSKHSLPNIIEDKYYQNIFH